MKSISTKSKDIVFHMSSHHSADFKVSEKVCSRRDWDRLSPEAQGEMIADWMYEQVIIRVEE